MRKVILVNLFLFLFMGLFAPHCVNAEDSPADLANPIAGTDSSYEFSRGNVYPAIALPFAMTAWTPQTGERHWLYKYNDKKIQCIRGTHSPSVWVGDYGNVCVMPVTGKLETVPKERASHYKHENEKAKPYYYAVSLDDYNVRAELTPTMRGSLFRFTFPESEDSYILVDVQPHYGYIRIIPEENKIIGYNAYGNRGNPKNFKCWFVAVFDKPFSTYGTYNDLGKFLESKEEEGKKVGGFAKFCTSRGEKIQMKIATSFISLEQAELNLTREIRGWDFDALKMKAKRTWNDALRKIEVRGGVKAQRRTFYTCLYRSMIFPRIFYEYDSNNRPYYYSAFDGEIHKGLMYADTGFWDTYRAQFPLFTIIMPKRVAEIINSLLNAYDNGGWIPKWPSPGYRNIMIGTHADSVIADAYCKGIRNFDVEKAYKAMSPPIW